MSTFALKMVAIIAMLIDHTAAVLVPQGSVYYIPMRCIGRLAFPIFCYLIVEGFNHTSNVKKYIIRLGLFALISEIPFDLAFYHEHFGSEFIKDFQGAIGSKYFILHLISYQNVFFTLFLGLCLITIMNMVEKKFDKQVIIINILNGLATIAFSILAAILSTDYNYLGILLIAAFYLFRGNKLLIGMSIFLVLGYLTKDPIYGTFATASMFFIGFYNGKKGKDVKYLFYIFYPAHLLILYLIYLIS